MASNIAGSAAPLDERAPPPPPTHRDRSLPPRRGPGALCRSAGMLGRRALVRNPPDRAARIVGDEQGAVLGDGERSGAAPDLGALFAGSPEAGREILVIALRPAVLERHARDFVAGRDRAVPRALHRDEQAALVFGGELVGLVEYEVEQRGMGLEQEVGGDRRFDLVGRELREPGLRVLADIRIGPAVEPALLDSDQVIGWQIVAEPVALLHDRPQFAGLRMKGECGRVAGAGGDRCLVRSVGIEPLDRRLGLGLDTEIAGRSDTNIEGAGFRTDRQMPVLVADRNAEYSSLPQHFRALGASYRPALGGGRGVALP